MNLITSYLDNLPEKGIIFIAATNSPSKVDSSLKRHGRLEKIISYSQPDEIERCQILKQLSENMPIIQENINFNILAQKTVGYVGADLTALCREAALIAIKEKREIITQQDFINALNFIKPSLRRSDYFEKANIKWEDIGGLNEIKLVNQKSNC